MKREISTKVNREYIHFYLDEAYLGMLVFAKGELSDFRAIIRKNKLEVNQGNLRKVLETSLYELLNQFLADREYVDLDRLQSIKTGIVKANVEALNIASKEIEKIW